ncbi:phage tail protein [Megamonas funiformis]|uniref:phage tail protein n=1 Tax=Megamonas funiformis TaxID=437897 RepID=UPI00374C8C94
MIVAWTLASNPSDSYLECNGQSVDSSKYPKLYALMHNTPDYRGVFLRGLGGNSDNLGVLQGDAIRNIYGSLPVNDNGSFPSPTGAFFIIIVLNTVRKINMVHIMVFIRLMQVV